jgi:hypothetical protein
MRVTCHCHMRVCACRWRCHTTYGLVVSTDDCICARSIPCSARSPRATACRADASLFRHRARCRTAVLVAWQVCASSAIAADSPPYGAGDCEGEAIPGAGVRWDLHCITFCGSALVAIPHYHGRQVGNLKPVRRCSPEESSLNITIGCVEHTTIVDVLDHTVSTCWTVLSLTLLNKSEVISDISENFGYRTSKWIIRERNGLRLHVPEACTISGTYLAVLDIVLCHTDMTCVLTTTGHSAG